MLNNFPSRIDVYFHGLDKINIQFPAETKIIIEHRNIGELSAEQAKQMLDLKNKLDANDAQAAAVLEKNK